MTAIYDVTIFISVGLATIVGAVFTVATAFLGRARERARAVAATEALRSQENLERLKRELAEPGGDWDRIAAAVKEEEARRGSPRLRVLFSGPHLLSVTHTVVVPGGAFLVAAALTAIAKWSNETPSTVSGEFWWWGGGLVAFVFGLARLVTVLRAVEQVGVTSEEAYFQAQVSAMKQALLETEQANLPQLDVEFPDQGLRFVAGRASDVMFQFSLVTGRIIRDCDILLFIPLSFAFGEGVDSQVYETGSFRGLRRTRLVKSLTLRKGYNHQVTINVVPPNEPGVYEFGYVYIAEEVNSDALSLEAVVTRPEEAA